MRGRGLGPVEPNQPEGRGEFSRGVRVAVSGSFNRHLDQIGRTIDDFSHLGAKVLSPQDNEIVDALGEFVFLGSDRRRSVKGVQNRHLAAIDNADLLYVVCPDGYTGRSVCFEIGGAVACQTPVLASNTPNDLTIRQYIDQIGTPPAAVSWAKVQRLRRAIGRSLILLEPRETIAVIHATLEDVEAELTGSHYRGGSDPAERGLKLARHLLSLPGYR